MMTRAVFLRKPLPDHSSDLEHTVSQRPICPTTPFSSGKFPFGEEVFSGSGGAPLTGTKTHQSVVKKYGEFFAQTYLFGFSCLKKLLIPAKRP